MGQLGGGVVTGLLEPQSDVNQSINAFISGNEAHMKQMYQTTF